MQSVPKMLNSKRLEYFLQVTVSGSVRGAAEILSVDPSSISRAISQLEKETGLTLMEKRGRGIVPTENGLILARYARRKQEILAEFHHELGQSRDATRGHIRLGIGEGMLDRFFHPLITDYMREYPHITLDLNISSVDQHIQDILEDRMNIAILYTAYDDVRLRYHLVLPTAPIHAIVHKNHPLAQIKRPLLLTDLAPYNGATMHDHFGLRQYVKAAELSERIQLKHVLVTSSYRALWQFADAGLGYTLCGPTFAAWFNMPCLVALPMKNPLLRAQIAVVTRAGWHPTPAARSLLEYLVANKPAPTALPGGEASATTVE